MPSFEKKVKQKRNNRLRKLVYNDGVEAKTGEGFPGLRFLPIDVFRPGWGNYGSTVHSTGGVGV